MYRLFALIGALLMALGMAGCNTMQGAGEDVEAAGETIQRGAEEASPSNQ
ncbi:MAG: entericidin A/B family lipoprotein [Thiohalomonadaceae bacterium]